MPKPWVLTRQAEAALKDIAVWTVETFGKRQADAYAENLRYARSGQHYVVFIAAPDRMIVVDFLHVRMDLPARLAALGEGDSGE